MESKVVSIMNLFTKTEKKDKHLDPEDFEKDANCSQIFTNKDGSRKLVKFWVFPVSAHQQQLEHHHGHIQLDDKFPYHGAHGRLTCDLHDKNWIPHIGINSTSNCKADTKNSSYQEIMFSIGKFN